MTELTEQLDKVGKAEDFKFYVENVEYDEKFNPVKWYFVGMDTERNIKIESFEYESLVVAKAIQNKVAEVLER